MIALFALLVPASASSLDLLEVGGAWGTPATTDATAIWWNPAGLAAGHGTRFTFEIAPTFANVSMDRTNPTYAHNPDAFGPADYDYGGLSTYTRTAPVPFLGVASDFGQPGLGVGIGFAVPHARGAKGTEEQPAHHTLIEGGNQAIYLMASAGYEIKDVFAIGFSGAFVSSTYNSDLLSETGTSLNDGLKETLGQEDDFYSDTMLEDTRYSSHVTTDEGGLKGSAMTFGAGIYIKPTDDVGISLAYRHGFRIDHSGQASLDFDCPSTDDIFGRIGAEVQGICDAQLRADMTVGYNLPNRLQGGVVIHPVDKVRLEAMGGWVNWSVFTDYEINIKVDPSTVDKDDADAREETAALVSQEKTWARDNKNTFWLGLDGKFDVHERVLVGGRVLYDRAAVPTRVLSTNNYDANTVSVTALVAARPVKSLEFGLSATQYFAQKRVNTESAYGLTVGGERKEGRYFYPEMNGTYQSSITRIGISMRGHFDHGTSGE